jgi:hypothetical protein
MSARFAIAYDEFAAWPERAAAFLRAPNMASKRLVHVFDGREREAVIPARGVLLMSGTTNELLDEFEDTTRRSSLETIEPEIEGEDLSCWYVRVNVEIGRTETLVAIATREYWDYASKRRGWTRGRLIDPWEQLSKEQESFAITDRDDPDAARHTRTADRPSELPQMLRRHQKEKGWVKPQAVHGPLFSLTVTNVPVDPKDAVTWLRTTGKASLLNAALDPAPYALEPDRSQIILPNRAVLLMMGTTSELVAELDKVNQKHGYSFIAADDEDAEQTRWYVRVKTSINRTETLVAIGTNEYWEKVGIDGNSPENGWKELNGKPGINYCGIQDAAEDDRFAREETDLVRMIRACQEKRASFST